MNQASIRFAITSFFAFKFSDATTWIWLNPNFFNRTNVGVLLATQIVMTITAWSRRSVRQCFYRRPKIEILNLSCQVYGTEKKYRQTEQSNGGEKSDFDARPDSFGRKTSIIG
jgi:hypothetical protein